MNDMKTSPYSQRNGKFYFGAGRPVERSWISWPRIVTIVVDRNLPTRATRSSRSATYPVSYTHLTLPTTPYV